MFIPDGIITGQIAKVVETAKGSIQNGFYYSDITNNVQNGHTFALATMDVREPTFNRMTGSSYGTTGVWKQRTNFIQDNKDPEIYYVCGNNGAASGRKWMKIREKDDGTCEELLIAGGSAGITEDIVYQDDNFIYHIQMTANIRYLIKNSKTTLAPTTVATIGSAAGYARPLFENATHIYFLVRTNNYQILDLYKFDKTAMTFLRITPNWLIPSTVVTTNVLGAFDYIEDLGGGKFEIWAPHVKTTTTAGMRKIILDFSKVQESEILVSSQEYTLDVALPYANLAHAFFEVFKVKEENDTYISVSWQENRHASTAAQILKYGLYTYKVVEETVNEVTTYKLELQGSGPSIFSTAEYLRDVVSISSDDRRLILGFDTYLLMAKWDINTHKYAVNKRIDIVPRLIGIDKDGYIRIMNSVAASTLTMNTLDWTEINTVSLTADATYFKYTGEDITSNVVVHSKDMEGLPSAVTVDLVIEGTGAVFENGDRRITVSTDGTGKSAPVPFTIKSANSFTIKPVSPI